MTGPSPADDPRDVPIPAPARTGNEQSFRLQPVDLTRPDSHEPLVDIHDAGLAGRSYYARADGLNPPYHRPLDGALPRILLRRSVVDRLLDANARLRPLGLEFFLLDGYRTIDCQMDIYRHFLEMARRALPDGDDEAHRRFLAPYIAWPGNYDPADPKTWISHITGAAVDLTLRERATGEPLFMGGVFDDPHEVSHTDFYERPGGPTGASADEARRNRRLLFWTLWGVGLANLPEEWWHYDYGNQLWAKDRRFVDPSLPIETAWYGPARFPA